MKWLPIIARNPRPSSSEIAAHHHAKHAPYRRSRFDINDDRMVQIDQVVGAVGKEGPVAIGASQARGRVGGREIVPGAGMTEAGLLGRLYRTGAEADA